MAVTTIVGSYIRKWSEFRATTDIFLTELGKDMREKGEGSSRNNALRGGALTEMSIIKIQA